MRRVLALSVVAVVLGGCGGSTSSSGTQNAPGDKRPVIGGKLLGKTTNCLIDENWLVQPEENVIQGTSAAGLQFSMRFYPSNAEAKKHAGKKRVVVDNAVFDYGSVSGQNIGVNITTAAITTEAKTIKKCLDVARR